MLLSSCEVCGSEKSRFIKEQDANGLLSMTGETPLLGGLCLFKYLLWIHIKVLIYEIK